MNRVDDMFSEVRSLMQKAELKNYEKTQLWSLIQESYTHNKTHYIEQWVPYLSSFPQHVKDTPLASINTLEELNIACSIAPFATFHYVIESTYTDASEFFASPLLPHISSLRTDTLEGIEHIAPTQLHNLNHLQINVDNKDILKHLNHLTQAPIIPSLTHYEHDHITMNDAGATLLANAPILSHIKTLALPANNFTSTGLHALLSSLHLSQVESLNLNDSQLGPDGVRLFAKIDSLKHIRELAIHGAGAGEDGATALFNSPIMQRLTSLDIGVNEIGDKPVLTLAQNQPLPHLKVLDINNNNIGKDALVTLINSRMVQQLTTLNLSGNTLSDDVGIALLESPHLSNLKNLDILHHNISTHTLNQLTTRFPKVTHSVPDFWWY